MAEVIRLPIRKLTITSGDGAKQDFGPSQAAVVITYPFGAMTRSERMRERNAGWSSEAIAAVRISEERRGNRK